MPAGNDSTLNVFNDLGSYFLKNKVGPAITAPLSPAQNRKLERTLETVNRNHPEWDDQEVLLYGRALMKVVPNLFDDPMMVESILSKIMLYGGLDPSMITELGKMNKYTGGGT